MTIRRSASRLHALLFCLLLPCACSDSGDGELASDESTSTGAASAEAPAAQEPVVAEIAWRSAPSADGSHFIRWRPLVEPIPMADLFDVEVELWSDESMSEPAVYESILVDAGMPHHGHGMNVVPELERRADGSWVARGMLMHMPGRWQVYVDVLDDGRLERAQWSMWLSG